ncbi:MAG: hypothetical protein A2X48_00440 [Lentisphaerae bacterium GWF2_49_21]|nr:MAG: hypothetical protein A2X48_00440 [Lentisphaerae bacterium GWF2_49_21]
MKRGFTLIELLVVMAIIAILASILLPAIARLRHNARVTEAKAQMNVITTAVNGYEAEYGSLPWMDGNNDNPAGDGTIDDAVWADWTSSDQCKYYDKLMELLICANGPAGYNLKNAREIRFIRSGFEKYPEKGIIDFWGDRFGIAMDLDGDNKISGTGTPLDGHQGKFIMWSLGPNKINEWSVSTSPKDDIPSW